jgi:2-haloacid dehalogenase
MQKPKAVVFDLLTALLDSWTLWNRAAGGQDAGRRWRGRYMELTYGCGAYQPYEELVAQAAREADLPSAAPAALLAGWDDLAPWPETKRVLSGLKAQGLRLGVATNCSQELGLRAAARCGVSFDAIVTAEEAGFYKPRPEPYRAVLAKLAVEPGDALFVAGSSADVPGATDVGMRVVWHNWIGLPKRPGPAPLRESPTLEAALAGLV